MMKIARNEQSLETQKDLKPKLVTYKFQNFKLPMYRCLKIIFEKFFSRSSIIRSIPSVVLSRRSSFSNLLWEAFSLSVSFLYPLYLKSSASSFVCAANFSSRVFFSSETYFNRFVLDPCKSLLSNCALSTDHLTPRHRHNV